MKSVAFAVLVAIAASADAQRDRAMPPRLIGAAHCLATKGFLQAPGGEWLILGYLVDERSYPGKKLMYVVVFADGSRSRGDVLSVFLESLHGRDRFYIQNNGSFTLGEREPGGLAFINPPLGGVWTQDHLVAAILAIRKEPALRVRMSEVLAAPDGACEAYTDP